MFSYYILNLYSYIIFLSVLLLFMIAPANVVPTLFFHPTYCTPIFRFFVRGISAWSRVCVWDRKGGIWSALGIIFYTASALCRTIRHSENRYWFVQVRVRVNHIIFLSSTFHVSYFLISYRITTVTRGRDKDSCSQHCRKCSTESSRERSIFWRCWTYKYDRGKRR